MNRRPRRLRVPPLRPEGLEPRGLLAAGISGGLNLVMELGEVSRAAALKGVEVAAPITANGSITFEFQAEVAGNYLLEVRHVGEGLTLGAAGPSGSASLDPGPAGPFKTIALALKPGDYQIKASSIDGLPVFVDWELILTTGVGQSAATGSTLASPSASVPLSGPVAPSPLTSSTVSGPIAPANWGPAVSPSLFAASGPVGRLDPLVPIAPVGPTSDHGEVALADSGDGLSVGALKALASVVEVEVPASIEATPLLTIDAMGDARQDLVALGNPSWLDQLAEFHSWATIGGQAERPNGDDAVAAIVSTVGDPLEAESELSMTQAASPGLVAAGFFLASAARRWGIGRDLLPGGPKSPMMPFAFPPSRPRWG